MAVTLKFQSTGTVPGNGAPIAMIGRSLTIGRGPENDVVLPDPDRLISKNHCAIEDHGGNVVVIDFSTNGTFLNYGKVPLGRVTTPLNDGDVLTMGTYELVVSITSSRHADPMAHIAPPVDDGPVSHGRASRVPDMMSLLDDPTQGGDFLDDLLGGATPPRGPGQVQRPDEIDPILLPPLGGDDDPLLAPPAPMPMQGASTPRHNAAATDHFTPARQQKALIPDDWEDDLLAPAAAPARDPFAAPPARVPDLPPDAFDDLLAPTPAPKTAREAAPPPPVPAAPAANVAAAASAAAVGPPPVSAPPASAPPISASLFDDPMFDDALSDPMTDALADPQGGAPAPELPSAVPVVVVPVTVAPVIAPMVASVAPATAPQPDPGLASARAFLVAAGAEDLNIADADLPATMTRLGGVFRSMIEGLREILMTRTSIKSEFRINQTMIGAGRNNPLKFSISPEQAIEAMIRPATKGYLDAQTATTEALRDIKAHEVAMVTGMEAALKGVLKRLDPKVLEAKLEGGGGIGDLLKGRKARYWEVYEKLYAEISDQAENDFHDLFSKEFARAYQDQLERLK